MRTLIIFFLFLTFPTSYAQNNSQGSDDFFKALKEQMKGDRQEMEKYFQGDFIDKMDEMVEKMHSDFFKQWEQLMQDDQVGDYFRQMELGQADIPMEWKKTDKGQSLIVQLKPIKDAPLEIKIDNHQIILKGTVEKTQEFGTGKSKVVTKRIYTFNKSIQIPDELDPQSADIHQAKDVIEIRFKLAKNKKRGVIKKQTPSQVPGVQPLVPQEGDINL
ncbi:MAG: hypothetical protein COW00_19880 [Bdellovibrio sp. CG12_big_fil_rev_8_21_14_0_65_39_13]|nr:MAG: hypothetical protein COW78_02055 [Bdellovibrio sp. CG22_combo_CG10-13_8_21_14_all_39_27]PIQ57635.1 MAG: hypothetical protein COW00_19880 [Bdellovibrio sp. CG12_big_fil_rev_8_21_14_0_65_39_13]PIR35799.1 MAG: hypothetical protein COV37_06260 [Bdellovibrio sp. CG11_big_fil_rev_8_21_14_0_20_39_38]